MLLKSLIFAAGVASTANAASISRRGGGSETGSCNTGKIQSVDFFNFSIKTSNIIH